VATVSSISLVSVGTLIGNQGALGNLLADAMFYHRPILAVSSVVTTAVLAILMDGVLVLLRRLLTPWQPRGTRSAARGRGARGAGGAGAGASGGTKSPAAPALERV
jgi:osmoprotectant transport system permease protein